MALVDAKCPNCGNGLRIDNEKKAAVCPSCGEAYIVQEAINNFISNNTYVDKLHADVVNVYSGKSRTFTKEQLLDRIKTYTLLGNINAVIGLFSELILKYPEEATKEKLLDYIQQYASAGESLVVRKLYSEYIYLYPEDYVGYWEMYKMDYEDSLKNAKTKGGICLRTLFVTDYLKNAILLNPSLEKDYYSMVTYAISNYIILDSHSYEDSDLNGIKALKASHPIRVSYDQGSQYVQKLNELWKKTNELKSRSEYIRDHLGRKIENILDFRSREASPSSAISLIGFSGIIGNTLMCYSRGYNDDTFNLSVRLSSVPSDIIDIIDKINQTLKSCYWFIDGRCPYCGGKTSYFTDICKQCGKERKLEWL
ncbi:MAG: hypothetical protein J5493_02805 [Lachnospiraceae bacterium]|nr:hypothetical protein [Lachnospiraceae bacterium]